MFDEDIINAKFSLTQKFSDALKKLGVNNIPVYPWNPLWDNTSIIRITDNDYWCASLKIGHESAESAVIRCINADDEEVGTIEVEDGRCYKFNLPHEFIKQIIEKAIESCLQ